MAQDNRSGARGLDREMERRGQRSDQRSSGEQAARREDIQQHSEPDRSRRSNREAERDQDDGGQNGVSGRDVSSR